MILRNEEGQYWDGISWVEQVYCAKEYEEGDTEAVLDAMKKSPNVKITQVLGDRDMEYDRVYSQRRRARNREAGMVRVEYWVTPEEREKMEEILKQRD